MFYFYHFRLVLSEIDAGIDYEWLVLHLFEHVLFLFFKLKEKRLKYFSADLVKNQQECYSFKLVALNKKTVFSYCHLYYEYLFHHYLYYLGWKNRLSCKFKRYKTAVLIKPGMHNIRCRFKHILIRLLMD